MATKYSHRASGPWCQELRNLGGHGVGDTIWIIFSRHVHTQPLIRQATGQRIHPSIFTSHCSLLLLACLNCQHLPNLPTHAVPNSVGRAPHTGRNATALPPSALRPDCSTGKAAVGHCSSLETALPGASMCSITG